MCIYGKDKCWYIHNGQENNIEENENVLQRIFTMMEKMTERIVMIETNKEKDNKEKDEKDKDETEKDEGEKDEKEMHKREKDESEKDKKIKMKRKCKSQKQHEIK